LVVTHASILLIEPPEDDRRVYADSLRENGFAVCEVESTDEGLAAARDADLVITAVRMPGSFDGIELVRRLRQDQRTKDTPLIVLTTCAVEPDQSRAFSAGCDVFLPKPCLPELLVAEAHRLIAQAIDLREGSRTARQRAARTQQASRRILAHAGDLKKKLHRLRKPQHR
jgi:CheY-like chemotaxis protein